MLVSDVLGPHCRTRQGCPRLGDSGSGSSSLTDILFLSDELFQKVAEDYVSVAAFQVMTGVCFCALSDFGLSVLPLPAIELPPLSFRGQGRGSGPEGQSLLLQLLSSLSHHSPGLGGLMEFPRGAGTQLLSGAQVVQCLSYPTSPWQQRWHLPVLAHGTEAALGWLWARGGLRADLDLRFLPGTTPVVICRLLKWLMICK